jgi:drug/metabolite transporter (DMT)-like permease
MLVAGNGKQKGNEPAAPGNYSVAQCKTFFPLRGKLDSAAIPIIDRIYVRHSQGFLFAMGGFTLLSCGDAVIKSMAGEWPASGIAAVRFLIAIPFLALLVGTREGRSGFIVSNLWVQLARGVSVAGASTLFFFSLFVMPLADATAIVFVSPVITALISAIFMREPMHWQAWLMTFLAMAGVSLVLRPNLAEIGWVAALPLASALFFSGLLIFNRRAAGTGSSLALQWIVACVAGPVLMLVAITGHLSGYPSFHLDVPATGVILRCALIAVSASAAHWLIYQGTVRARAADAAQAVYIQLPVALLLDALLFGNIPDVMAFAGVALIVMAGLGMWIHQRRRPMEGAHG